MKNKLLRQLIMLTKLVVCATFLQSVFVGILLASDSKAQEVKDVHQIYVTLDESNVSVQGIFQSIESSTNLHFSYYLEEFNSKQEISISKKRQLVSDVLMQISKETDLSFGQLNNSINVRKKERGFHG